MNQQEYDRAFTRRAIQQLIEQQQAAQAASAPKIDPVHLSAAEVNLNRSG